MPVSYAKVGNFSNATLLGDGLVWSGLVNGIQLNGDYKEGGDGYIDSALIENNVVYNNTAKGFSLISVRYGTIRNNITYGNNGAGGIHLVQESGGSDLTYYSVGNTVVNNTLDETSTACVRINNLNTNNVVFNNICTGSTGVVCEDDNGDPASCATMGNYSSNNISTATGFVNRAGHDYSLLSNSPAKDYGLSTYQTKSAPTIDFAGVARPQNGTFDAGAYEYFSGVADTTAPAAPSGLGVM